MNLDSIRTKKDVADDLSENLGTRVAPAESVEAEYGDSLIFAEIEGETQAYLAEGALQNSAAGDVDYIEQWGVISESSNFGASANQYSGEVPDQVASMLESDVAAKGKEIQGRDEFTEASLEPETNQPGDRFVESALDEGSYGLRATD